MNIINHSGAVINDNGKIEVVNGSLAIGQNASVNIGNKTNNKWSKVDNWIQENRSNINNYEALQQEINFLKSQIDIKIEQNERKSIIQRITDAVGFVDDAFGLIQLIKEIF